MQVIFHCQPGLFIASLLNFFFIFFIILFFCFIFLYPTSPHDMQVIFHCHLNLFITTPTLFNIGHRHKSQVSIDDGKWKNNEISLHLQSISAWLRFCTRNWHSDSSVLLEIWQNVSRTECKKTQPKICSGFQLGGCKDEAKDWVVYKGRPPRVIFVLFVKADMSLHQVWGKERSNNVEWPSWPQTNPHPTSQQTWPSSIFLFRKHHIAKNKNVSDGAPTQPHTTSQPTRPFTIFSLSNKQRT